MSFYPSAPFLRLTFRRALGVLGVSSWRWLVLVLAVADAAAALVGGRYGRIRYEVEDQCKSLEGSLVFAAVTFVIDDTGGQEYRGSGWVYPDLTPYTSVTVERLIAEAGLVGIRIPWFHPRQVWYLLAVSAGRLPAAAEVRELTGKVLLTAAGG